MSKKHELAALRVQVEIMTDNYLYNDPDLEYSEVAAVLRQVASQLDIPTKEEERY